MSKHDTADKLRQLTHVQSSTMATSSSLSDSVNSMLVEQEFANQFDYNGYDGSVSFVKDDKGDFRGYFAKEFRNCGNGYYYLLINDNYFIGYDVD